MIDLARAKLQRARAPNLAPNARRCGKPDQPDARLARVTSARSAAAMIASAASSGPMAAAPQSGSGRRIVAVAADLHAGHQVDEALGLLLRGRAAGQGQDDGEVVAAEVGDDVARPHAPDQQRRHLAEQRVHRRFPLLAADLRGVGDGDDEQGVSRLRHPAAGDDPRQLPDQVPPVADGENRMAVGQALQIGFAVALRLQLLAHLVELGEQPIDGGAHPRRHLRRRDAERTGDVTLDPLRRRTRIALGIAAARVLLGGAVAVLVVTGLEAGAFRRPDLQTLRSFDHVRQCTTFPLVVEGVFPFSSRTGRLLGRARRYSAATVGLAPVLALTHVCRVAALRRARGPWPARATSCSRIVGS